MKKQIQKINNLTSSELSKAITFSGIYSKVKLTISAKLILWSLTDFWNPETSLISEKQKTIAECTGIALSSVKRAIEELISKGLILKIKEKGSTNAYYFTNLFWECIKPDLDPNNQEQE